MTLLPIISKSLRYLFTQPLRAISSLLGVLFGVVAVITMLSIGEGAKKEAIEQVKRLGVDNIILRQIPQTEEQKTNAKEKSKGLSLNDVKLIETSLPSIKHVAPVKTITASIQGKFKEVSPELIATTGNLASIYDLHFSEGRPLSAIDVQKQQQVCVLGSEIAASLGKDGHVGKLLRIQDQLFKIVGVLSPRSAKSDKTLPMSTHNFNQRVLIPLGTEKAMRWNLFQKKEPLTEIVVQAKNSDETLKLSKLLKRTLEINHKGVEDYQIVVPQELIHQAQETQRTFNLILGSIAFISLLVGGIGIMNVMLATISERTREIGIRRAVGASQNHILLQFLVETLILTLSGALLGILVGVAVSNLISWMAGWQTIITLYSILLSLFLASGVGLFSGLYPAIKASKMHPIAALRSY